MQPPITVTPVHSGIATHAIVVVESQATLLLRLLFQGCALAVGAFFGSVVVGWLV